MECKLREMSGVYPRHLLQHVELLAYFTKFCIFIIIQRLFSMTHGGQSQELSWYLVAIKIKTFGGITGGCLVLFFFSFLLILDTIFCAAAPGTILAYDLCWIVLCPNVAVTFPLEGCC